MKKFKKYAVFKEKSKRCPVYTVSKLSQRDKARAPRESLRRVHPTNN